jgi:hypothetical protein
MRRSGPAAAGSLDRARRARDALARRFGARPGVTGIDIGLDPAQGADPDATIALRVHVARGAAAPPDLPGEVDGIPVRVLTGDYRLGWPIVPRPPPRTR